MTGHRGRTPTAARGGGAALGLLLAVQLMITLDSSIVVVALPSIAADLGLATTSLQWVISGYALTFGGLLVLGGRAADLTGRRRMFLVGLGVFSLASLACALAGTSELLIGARLVQGAGAAALAPALLSLITTMFDEGPQRTRALGLWGAAAAGGAAGGLLLGGLLTEVVGWPWLFAINVPVGVVGLVLGRSLLDRDSGVPTSTGPVDVAGGLTLTAGLGLGLLALVRVPEVGAGSPETIVTAVAAVLALIGFVVVESRAPLPLVPLRVLRSRGISGANLVVLVLFACQAAVAFFVTLYLQQALGYSPLAVGLAFLPVPLLVLAISTLGGPRALDRVGARPLLLAGSILLTASLLWFSRISADGSYAVDVLPGFVLFGTALGLSFFSSAVVGTAGVPAHEQGLATSLINTSQQIGGALGLGLFVPFAAARTDTLAGLLGTATTSPDAAVGGYADAFLAAALISLLALAATALVVPGRPSRPRTPHRGGG